MTRCFTLAVLFGLPLAGCADRDEAIPPTLAALHQRAARSDATAPLNLGLRYVTSQGIPPDEGPPCAGSGTPPLEATLPPDSSWVAITPWSRTGTSGGRPLCCASRPFKASPRRKPVWQCCT